MKAYITGITDDDDAGNEIVFANTAREARKMVWGSDFTAFAERYIDVYARRYPNYDGMENLSKKELALQQWHDGWWFHQSGYLSDDEWTDEQFIQWYEETFEPLIDGKKYQIRLKNGGRIFNRCFYDATNKQFKRGKGIISLIPLADVESYKFDTDPFDS